jgi:hypothetical protein
MMHQAKNEAVSGIGLPTLKRFPKGQCDSHLETVKSPQVPTFDEHIQS